MAIVYKAVGCLLLLTILGLYHGAHAATQARATWYFLGDAVTTNTTLSLNTGDTFTAQCKAAGGAAIHATGRPTAIIAKSSFSRPTFVNRAVGELDSVTFTSGTQVFNSIQGAMKGFDHWQVSAFVPQTTLDGDFGLALVQISIPRLNSDDVGTYYCLYHDGSADGNAVSAASVGISTGLTLQIATRSSGRNLATSKMLDYSFALLTAYKIMY